MNPRQLAAEAWVKSIRTGEHSASLALAPHLAESVELDTNGPTPGAPTETVRGRTNVLQRASGNWAVTYAPRQAQPTEVIPPGARPLINNARINETPILVAHTDENGNPVLTFRGSIQVWNDTALCAWIRQ